MTTHQLVRTEHLNQYGLLFGGQLLAWVDEAVVIAARLEYPKAEFVTLALSEVEFRRPVALGSVLALKATCTHRGRTSLGYHLDVSIAANPAPGQVAHAAKKSESVFHTTVTLVHIDKQGRKKPLPNWQ